jgi:RNA polymerase sigma factor (sigma-70 family)
VRTEYYKIEDRILLNKAARNGCAESLAMIYRKYRSMICDFLLNAGADGLEEDVCQSVFVHIREGKCNYDGSSEVKNYLFGVAKNLFKQEVTTDKTKTYKLSRVQTEGDLIVKQTIQACPAESLGIAESRQILREIVAQLPPKSHQAVKLVYLEGIPAKEAAMIAKCDFKVFRKRLDYGLRCLKKHKK